MCLRIAQKPVFKKAAKDIWVDKYIKNDHSGIYYSLVIDGKIERWEEGYHYTEDNPFDIKSYSNYLWEIEGRCFHSYIKCKDILITSVYKKVKMYIPKGALYFIAGDEVVSSEIVFPIQRDLPD